MVGRMIENGWSLEKYRLGDEDGYGLKSVCLLVMGGGYVSFVFNEFEVIVVIF